MDPKLLLLFLVSTVAAVDKCEWKRGSYVSLVLELLFRFDKTGVCDSIDSFHKKIESRQCLGPEEKLIFKAFNESCESDCNLYDVFRTGKALAFKLSMNRERHTACLVVPAIENILDKQKCKELQQVLHQVLHDCDEQGEVKLEVNLTNKAV